MVRSTNYINCILNMFILSDAIFVINDTYFRIHGFLIAKNPMYSVVLAAAVNFSLDLVLCSLFGKGIVGAAWATLVSQYCAAALLLRVLAVRG